MTTGIRENEVMREFTSIQDYREFAKSVTFRSRYVFESHVEEFLLTVIETSAKRIEMIDAPRVLYRAQLGCDVRWELVDPQDSSGETVDVPVAFSSERMKPPRDSAREGRVNPKGIPCLYLADEINTAMAETRPWLGSDLSVAEFETVRPLKIMNLPAPKRCDLLIVTILFGASPPDAAAREEAVWGEIAYAFSEPVTLSDVKADYAPTQVLAEIFRKLGCDGVCYKSLLGEGRSFALFDLDCAAFVKSTVCETKAIKFEFRQGSFRPLS